MIDDPLVKSLLMNILEDEKNLEIVRCLIDGIDTDEEISEKTGIKLNFVRKYLYKLYDKGLATYKRSKDKESGWYSYSWEFDKEETINTMKESSEFQLQQLKEELQREENNMFFVCPQGHCRLNFDDASELEFMCPECGEDLELFDNTELKKQIQEDIDTIEKNFEAFSKKVK